MRCKAWSTHICFAVRFSLQVSKIAKGKLSRSVVFRGSKVKTSGGLTKGDLTKSKSGKIVSKKASAAGKKAYKNISGWTKAVQQARKALGVKGFAAVGGKSAAGKAPGPPDVAPVFRCQRGRSMGQESRRAGSRHPQEDSNK